MASSHIPPSHSSRQSQRRQSQRRLSSQPPVAIAPSAAMFVLCACCLLLLPPRLASAASDSNRPRGLSHLIPSHASSSPSPDAPDGPLQRPSSVQGASLFPDASSQFHELSEFSEPSDATPPHARSSRDRLLVVQQPSDADPPVVTPPVAPPDALPPRVVELDACALQSLLPQLLPPALLDPECAHHLALPSAHSSPISPTSTPLPSSLPSSSSAPYESSATSGDGGDEVTPLYAAATRSDLLEAARNKATARTVWAPLDVEGAPDTGGAQDTRGAGEATPASFSPAGSSAWAVATVETSEATATASTLTPANEVITVCRSAGPASITISPDLSGQTWRGWGTSLAWSANYIGKLPPDQLNLLLDLLFSPTAGLGLNLARYLIGASFNATNSPQLTLDTMHQTNLPGYKPTQAGPYDWEADWRQRKVLQGAMERGLDEVEAIVYSPPWWMTISGDTAGNVAGQCNLQPDMYDEFADYVATIAAHFHKEWNVTFSTLNPANEPLEGWWQQGGKHEGCSFNAAELERLCWAMAGALKKRKLPTQVAGFDSFVGFTSRNANKFSARLKSTLARISMHGYVPPPPDTTDARAFIEELYVGMARMGMGVGKELWVSEIGPMWAGGADVDVGLFMMRSAIQAINIMGVSAWIYWQAINPILPGNPNSAKWGLFGITHNNVSDPTIIPLVITFSKKFYMLKQMSLASRRDSMPLRISTADGCHHCIAAFFNPDKNFISIFIVNQDGADYTVTFTFESFALLDASSPCVVEVQRTSESEDAAVVTTDSYATMLRTLPVTAVGRSITTIMISNVVWL
ncbi:hypothetical protein CLOM_g16645 [Closterium sp. NIES-68]|nr:hypothetical protein CLOM_g16645 [Closterium sp. NIES-68]